MKLKILGAALAAMLAGATTAQAATYILDFSGAGGVTAQFDVTTSDTLNAVNGYDVVALTGGKVNGEAITGLRANPSQPNPFNDGVWIYDNVLFPGVGGLVDYYGIVGELASGGTANLFLNGPSDYELMVSPPGGGYSLDSHGLATLSEGVRTAAGIGAVPEPEIWMTMIAGLFGAGVALRVRRKARAGASLA